jgi:hypothetical protein
MVLSIIFFDPENGNSPSLNRKGKTDLGTEAFEALRRVSSTDALYNSRYRSCPPCDPDTRTDILSKIFDQAHDVEAHRICWLYGIAGSDKSSLFGGAWRRSVA